MSPLQRDYLERCEDRKSYNYMVSWSFVDHKPGLIARDRHNSISGT